MLADSSGRAHYDVGLRPFLFGTAGSNPAGGIDAFLL
jgi:hypothetical protein